MPRVLVVALVCLAACTPATSVATPSASLLNPYLTVTASSTAEPSSGVVAAQTPSPSPTPSKYIVKSGDTLGQIAEHFRITLDALMQANPGVDPNALGVGDSLEIPVSPADRAGQSAPTPVPLPLRQVACHATANGAVWCFALVENDTANLIEDITAQVNLVDGAGSQVASASAYLPLDILPSGAALPLSVFFPPSLPLDIRPQVQILTAVSLLPDDRRYVPADTRNTLAQVSWPGRSAMLSGEIALLDPSASASVVWLVAVAYDARGNVVGWRRWDSTTGIGPGAALPFSFMVSSLAGPIDRVEYVVEARP